MSYDLTTEPATPEQTTVDRLLDKLVEMTGLQLALDIVLRLLRRAVYGHRPYQQFDRLALASARLRLVAPADALELVRRAEAVARLYKPGDEEWKKRWMDLRTEMREGFREILDEIDG